MPAGTISVRVVRVVDGDTIKVMVGRRTERVRLIGMDTPETKRNRKFERDIRKERTKTPREVLAAGREAKEYMSGLLKRGDAVRLEKDVQERDKYGRLLAYVWLEGGGPQGKPLLLNAALLENGYARLMTIPPNVKRVEYFRKLQEYARQNHAGIWSRLAR
ncbi:MAG TPA: thermonuclease family protein [Nitrospirota bacterium]